MEKKTFLDKLENFNEQLNIAHYWIIFLKYKKVILILPVFFGLLGYLGALNIKPIFQSNATIVITAQEKKIVDIEEVYSSNTGGFTGTTTHINNQIQIIKSDEVLNEILREKETLAKIKKLYKTIPEKFFARNLIVIKKLVFFLQDTDNNKVNISRKADLKKYIKSNFKIKHVRQSDVVQLSFESHSPELAKYLLTLIIEAYLRYDVDTKIAVTAYANKQIRIIKCQDFRNYQRIHRI